MDGRSLNKEYKTKISFGTGGIDQKEQMFYSIMLKISRKHPFKDGQISTIFIYLPMKEVHRK